jgi:cell filamentation protein, protein adenylyltransferase
MNRGSPLAETLSSKFIPESLPLKKLKWSVFRPQLKKAHQVIDRFNRLLKKFPNPVKQLQPLMEQEAKNSVGDRGGTKILRYLQTLRFIIQKKPPLTLNLLRILHKRINKSGPDVGRFRTRQNWIGYEGAPIEEAKFFPPKASLVPIYMKNLQSYLDYKEKDPLIQLAIYVAQLLTIHPFMDGNGRVARLCIPLFLYHKGLTDYPLFFWSGFSRKYHTQYYNQLFALSGKDDWEGWILFFLKGVIAQGEKACKKMRSEKSRPS